MALIRWRRATLLGALVTWPAYVNQPAALKAQRYIIEGWPIKKTWGQLVRFGRPVGKRVFRELLPRIRLWGSRKHLCG